MKINRIEGPEVDVTLNSEEAAALIAIICSAEKETVPKISDRERLLLVRIRGSLKQIIVSGT